MTEITKFAVLQSIVLVEIQDTLKQPPSEMQSIKKAVRWGVVTTVSTFTYNALWIFASSTFGHSCMTAK